MRARVPWMNEVDDAILEYYRTFEGTTDSRLCLPPMAVWYNLVEELGALDRSSATISRRMKILDEMGLLEKVDAQRGYYRITNKGLAYLEGDLDAEDLQLPDDE